MVHRILCTISWLWPLPPATSRLCGWPAGRAALLRYWGQLSVSFLSGGWATRGKCATSGTRNATVASSRLWCIFLCWVWWLCIFFLLSLYLCRTVGGGSWSIFRSPQLHDSNLFPTCCLQSRVDFNANYRSYSHKKTSEQWVILI